MKMQTTKRLAAAVLGLALVLVPAVASQAAKPADAVTVVNVNTAGHDQLVELPGIGDAKADAILALRKERGSFRSLDELLEVKGIGPKALERMRPYVTLQGRSAAKP